MKGKQVIVSNHLSPGLQLTIARTILLTIVIGMMISTFFTPWVNAHIYEVHSYKVNILKPITSEMASNVLSFFKLQKHNYPELTINPDNSIDAIIPVSFYIHINFNPWNICLNVGAPHNSICIQNKGLGVDPTCLSAFDESLCLKNNDIIDSSVIKANLKEMLYNLFKKVFIEISNAYLKTLNELIIEIPKLDQYYSNFIIDAKNLPNDQNKDFDKGFVKINKLMDIYIDKYYTPYEKGFLGLQIYTICSVTILGSFIIYDLIFRINHHRKIKFLYHGLSWLIAIISFVLSLALIIITDKINPIIENKKDNNEIIASTAKIIIGNSTYILLATSSFIILIKLLGF